MVREFCQNGHVFINLAMAAAIPTQIKWHILMPQALVFAAAITTADATAFRGITYYVIHTPAWLPSRILFSRACQLYIASGRSEIMPDNVWNLSGALSPDKISLLVDCSSFRMPKNFRAPACYLSLLLGMPPFLQLDHDGIIFFLPDYVGTLHLEEQLYLFEESSECVNRAWQNLNIYSIPHLHPEACR